MSLDPGIKLIYNYLNVMIMKVIEGKDKEHRYSIHSTHRHLKGTFSWHTEERVIHLHYMILTLPKQIFKIYE
jgi:hypothetical protein